MKPLRQIVTRLRNQSRIFVLAAALMSLIGLTFLGFGLLRFGLIILSLAIVSLLVIIIIKERANSGRVKQLQRQSDAHYSALKLILNNNTANLDAIKNSQEEMLWEIKQIRDLTVEQEFGLPGELIQILAKQDESYAVGKSVFIGTPQRYSKVKKLAERNITTLISLDPTAEDFRQRSLNSGTWRFLLIDLSYELEAACNSGRIAPTIFRWLPAGTPVYAITTLDNLSTKGVIRALEESTDCTIGIMNLHRNMHQLAFSFDLGGTLEYTPKTPPSQPESHTEIAEGNATLK